MYLIVMYAFVVVKQDISIQNEDLAIFFHSSCHISPPITLTLLQVRIV